MKPIDPGGRGEESLISSLPREINNELVCALKSAREELEARRLALPNFVDQYGYEKRQQEYHYQQGVVKGIEMALDALYDLYTPRDAQRVASFSD